MTIDPDTLAWLADFLLQSSVLLTLGLLASLLLFRLSASKRNFVLWLTAMGVPLLLLFSAHLPTQYLQLGSGFIEPASPEVTSTQSIEFGAPIVSSVPFEKSTAPETITPALKQTPAIPVTTWLIILWITGVMVCWIRLVVAMLSLAKITPTNIVPSTGLEQLLADECQSLGIKSIPALIFLSKDTMPMTWQIRNHVIALPESALAWSPSKLRHVIRHELAHVKRRDCLLTLLTELSLALVWFNPLTYILRKALETTREAACDDLALTHSTTSPEREEYANHLLEIVTTHSRHSRSVSPALAMAQRAKGIKKRLSAILDEHRDRSPSTGRSRVIAPILWLGGVTLLATLSACRTSPTPPVISTPNTTTTPTSRVKVTLMAFETEDPRRFKNFMPADESMAGVVTLRGLINTQAVDILLADYKSDKKIDLVASHSVVTPLDKSGRIEQITEFIYPTEYSPPELPKSTGKFVGDEGAVFPVTPATPTNFETKNLGIMFDATPKRRNDFIELTCNLTHTHFLGFVNYGSPINAPATDFLGFPVEVVITENRIEMPVFNSKRTKTTVTVTPGQTIVLAGPAPEPDPNLKKRLTNLQKPGERDLSKPKSTLYFITPEYVESE